MRKTILIPVAILMGWWAISVTISLASSRAERADEMPSSPFPPSTSVPKVDKPAAPAGRQPASKTSGISRSSAMSHPFEYPSELTSYMDLHEKVMLSDQEKREKTDLLRHTGLIKAMGKRLREASRTPEVMTEQDAAIDFLIEALKDGDTSVASEVLRDVVQDRQVEDAGLDRGLREQLAGLKAEVLYQWSAMNPGISGTLQAWLPGPVSRKIWANVLRMQQSNLAESEEHVRSGNH
jgi:hypothetical protein